MRLPLLAAVLSLSLLSAAEHRGRVTFNGVAVPGATVSAARGSERYSTITAPDGAYAFSDLSEGAWDVQVEMLLFVTQQRTISVAAGSPAAEWILEPRPISAPLSPARPGFQRPGVASSAAPSRPAAAVADPTAAQELTQRAADGLLINGSVNNGAASVFAQLPAFGNERRGPRALYNGNLGLVLSNSAFDARPFSLTGQETPKPVYSHLQGLFAFGGPLRIPRLLAHNGPNFTLNYQWNRTTNARTQTGLTPSAAERSGDLSASAQTALDTATGTPWPGNRIPASRLSPQAAALLPLVPLPNFDSSSRYNYQIANVSHQHQDDLQTRASKQAKRNFYSGSFAWQSARSDTPDLFSLLDSGRLRASNADASYRRTFSPRAFATFGLQYSRQTTRLTPYFSRRRNVSAEAGIGGNSQAPVDWGPPALIFSSGLSALAPTQASLQRNQTMALRVDAFLSRGRHNLQYGGAHRRQQFNTLAQQDARGTFTFTGAAAGSDLAGFLQGVPDTSSIAYGNADKYLRANVAEAYVSDDWRVNPGLTVNAGVRWESWSAAEEKYGRLVNLLPGAGFAAVSTVIAAQSGAAAFPRRDWNHIAPRVAFSWRPLAASSLVIRGGYGLYLDTSVYQALALKMAQQAPLSKSLRVASSAARPLNLADGFPAAAASQPTFAVDAGFQPGASHNWQFSVQRDLPAGLQFSANYEGSKGTHLQQQMLPNTYPDGAANSCPACPSGFTWLTSGGNSARNAGRFQLRRRLRSGFTAGMDYSYAQAMDNASPGGRGQAAALIAQNWLDLGAERARSNFDQRQILTATAQYTSGMGLRGGAPWSGWRGRLLKEWTLGTQLSAGSGLPLNPVYSAAVRGTGVTGTLRPDFTGADAYAAPAGLHLNPAAVKAPATGRWGNAGRNSLRGPSQFSLQASLARTFRSSERLSLDLRLEAQNVLNTVTFPSWIAVGGSAQFGLPLTANPMRSVQAVVRARF